MQIGDQLYIYLEYVHPGSINKYVRQYCGAMTESVVRCFTRHILNGLIYLHSKNIVHRSVCNVQFEQFTGVVFSHSLINELNTVLII